MRIGVLGGTFNPVHMGHLRMAEAARDAFSLDLVLLMVAADPPHKRVAGAVMGTHRLRMAALAAEHLPRIEASDLELLRSGRSYSYDTLLQLQSRYSGAELFWIVGSDMLHDLSNWHRAAEFLRLTAVIAVPRSGRQANDGAEAARLITQYQTSIRLLPAAVPPISSTEVRARIRAGLPVTGLVPDAVERYLYEEGLYFLPARDAMRAALREALTPARYRHSLGTVRQSAYLAALYGADAQTASNAQLAALLHDCAKQLPRETLLALSGEDTPAGENVRHAFAGAVLAHTRYGVTDEAVLRAIRLHCTGDAGMTLLDRIVYLADLTEPGRTFEGAAYYRERLADGSEAAMRAAIDGSLEKLRAERVPIHPATLRAKAYFDGLCAATILNDRF